MLSKIIQIFIDNRKLLIISFEMFWIMIFLIEKIAGNNSIEVQQFIYVNF